MCSPFALQGQLLDQYTVMLVDQHFLDDLPSVDVQPSSEDHESHVLCGRRGRQCHP